MPYTDSPYHELERLLNFDFLNLFTPNEHTEDYYIRKPNDKNFLFEFEDKMYAYVGDKVFRFETNDKIVKNSSELGLNDFKNIFAYGEENIYFKLHQK